MLSIYFRQFLKIVLLMIFLSSLSFMANSNSSELQLTINDFSATRYWAKQWVEYERLPPSFHHQAAKDEEAFKRAWADAGAAANKVIEKWDEAFKNDPLLKCAFDCLNRFHKIEWEYSILRKGLRRQYGLDGFNNLNRKGRNWIETNGSPWLNLRDTELVQLMLWWGEYCHTKRNKSNDNEHTAPYGWLTKPDDWLSQWSEEFLSLSPADLIPEETLTEERAIELFRIGVKRKRSQARKQHEDLTAKLELPTALYQYLTIRHEAEAMHYFGYSYLQIEFPKLVEVEKAEAEFNDAMESVATLCPNALEALHSVHTEAFNESIDSFERRRTELQAILAKDVHETDTTLK